MNRAVYTLLVAQFLTAFADNAILFTAFAMITQAGGYGAWYKPALQASFLIAFVVLAPWVGRFADQHAKGRVLTWGNGFKMAGTLLLLSGVDPLLAYGVVGVGAAVYGPAKYGILPDLVDHDKLVKANGWVEGSTIVAILLGMVIGAHIADQSIGAALALVAGSYLVSLLSTLFIPQTTARRRDAHPALGHFIVLMRGFFTTSRARFSMIGVALFWASAVVLRVMLVAWAPAVLLTHTTSDIANLTVFIAIGIALGALVVPWIVPIEQLRRTRFSAYLMGFCMVLLAITSNPLCTKGILLLIGLSGGVIVVPINAALQEIGHRSIGAGGAVAIQNFFENLAMLIATGLYSAALTQKLDPVVAILSLGVMVVITTLVIAWHLPRVPDPLALERSEQ